MRLWGSGGADLQILRGIERAERHSSLKQILKIAQALAVEPHELLVVEQEEFSPRSCDP
jgi:hypothetical protein